MSCLGKDCLEKSYVLCIVLGTPKTWMFTVTLCSVLSHFWGNSPRGGQEQSLDSHTEVAEALASGIADKKNLPSGPETAKQSQGGRLVLPKTLPHSFTTSHLCFYFQTKEPIKNKEGEEIKQTEDEKTKQIYKSWKEDSEWQASCEYRESGVSEAPSGI